MEKEEIKKTITRGSLICLGIYGLCFLVLGASFFKVLEPLPQEEISTQETTIPFKTRENPMCYEEPRGEEPPIFEGVPELPTFELSPRPKYKPIGNIYF